MSENKTIRVNSCLVSIVTISKNNLNGLLKTLASVEEQDYEHIQHIVIDGDSNDGSKKILQSFSHSKIYNYCSESDNGISNAFNKSIDMCRGDLILFLNSGDILHTENTISQVVRNYLQDKWKFAVGKRILLNSMGEKVVYSPPKLSSSFLKYFMFLPHQATICETSLHKNYKFNESIKTSMDYDLFIRMLQSVEISYLPFIVSECEPGGVSSQTVDRINEQCLIRNTYANSFIDKFMVKTINLLIRSKALLKIGSPFASKN